MAQTHSGVWSKPVGGDRQVRQGEMGSRGKNFAQTNTTIPPPCPSAPCTSAPLPTSFDHTRHRRYVTSLQSSSAARGVRLSVEFRRKDLLWISPCPITNPVTGEDIELPIRLSDTISIGPNVLDVMKQEIIEVEEDSEITAPDGSKHITKNLVKKRIWQLRPFDEFFAVEEEEENEVIKDTKTSPDGLYHIFQNPSNPLRKSFCTGGTIQGESGDFLAVTKRSSVSINALVYRLAIGMTGSSLAASQYIGTIAADAWERDLIRAVELYNLIAQTPGGFLPDSLVPTALKAGASIAQVVENAVLRDACNWLGIDPDATINRRQGRPRSRKHNEAGEPTSAGQYIELTLQLDGTVTGRLIADFHGFSSGTNLATLTLTSLASMLVALREGELVSDADLLEAYLDAVDADWRAKIAEEIGVETSSTAIDSWTVLGVEPGASLDEVKRAYKKIMRTVHPDASGLPRWYAQTVNDAYRRLLEELDRS